MNIVMNKQNKRKLIYSQAHVNKTNLQPANDTRDQELNYANNIKLKNKPQ